MLNPTHSPEYGAGKHTCNGKPTGEAVKPLVKGIVQVSANSCLKDCFPHYDIEGSRYQNRIVKLRHD